MVTDCLSGVQETLNTCVSFLRGARTRVNCPHLSRHLGYSYNVSHDVFDFESELGWEGSNDKVRATLALVFARQRLTCSWHQVMAIMKNSDYFVPPTQCNAAGVPQARLRGCSAGVCA